MKTGHSQRHPVLSCYQVRSDLIGLAALQPFLCGVCHCFAWAVQELTSLNRPWTGVNMNLKSTIARCSTALLGALLVSACAGVNGSKLAPGVSTRSEVIASMGQPAMVWKNADGSEQLAYPRGPAGTQTYMADVGADGKLQRIVGVLNEPYFQLVEPGMTQAQVLRIVGPSGAFWTQSFPRTNTLAWTWLYCANGNFQNYFDVYFDATTLLVRSTGRSQVIVGRLGGTPGCTQDNVGLP